MTTPPDETSAGLLQGKRVFVGVTGGIAAYKTVGLVSRLVQSGAEVSVGMTESAAHFVTPLSFQAISGKPVYTDMWQHIESQDPQHISLASSLDLAIVAPCTMDCMAKLVAGLTGDMVTLVLAAVDRSKTPVLLAPSMNEVMWSQPSTRRNTAQLEQDGFLFIGPGSGWQACRAVGPGRMEEPERIYDEAARLLGARPLDNRGDV